MKEEQNLTTTKAGDLLRLQNSVDSQDSEVYGEDDVTAYHVIEDCPFILVKEENKWMIVMGSVICSIKRFETKEDAISYINSKPWELIIIGSKAYSQLFDNIKNLEQHEQES